MKISAVCAALFIALLPILAQEQPKTDTAPLKVEAQKVRLEVSVVDKSGNFIPGIPEQYFHVYEDGVLQKTAVEKLTDAPLTVCMVIEFSNLFQSYWSETWEQTLIAAYGFLESLREGDYVAIVAYDMRPEMLQDFTKDKQKAEAALQRLRFAAYSESNLFDALADTLERMEAVEGRKAVVLISSGIDTFSKLTFDKMRKAVQGSDTTIYAVGLMQALREWYDARGYLSSIARLDFLQADNQLRTFAQESGGIAFFPRFYGQFPSIFRDVADAMRNKYALSYTPTNATRDGKFRKINVQLLDPETGKDLKIVDEKSGKAIKYRVVAKKGYMATTEEESSR